MKQSVQYIVCSNPFSLLFSGNHHCNWAVPYQNHCILLQCQQLSVCQNAGKQGIRDLLGGNAMLQAPAKSRILVLLLYMPTFRP